ALARVAVMVRALAAMTPLTSRVVGAGVDEQPVQPGIEARPVAQSPEVAPGTHERVLDGVLSRVLVAQDPPGDRVETVVRPGRERVEGGVSAALRALHEVDRPPVVPRLPRGMRPRLNGIGVPRSANPSIEGIRPAGPRLEKANRHRGPAAIPRLEVRDVPEALSAPTTRPRSRDRPGHRVWWRSGVDGAGCVCPDRARRHPGGG